MIRRALVEVYTALLLPLPKSTRLMTPYSYERSNYTNIFGMILNYEIFYNKRSYYGISSSKLMF